ncbi:hypothetical protein BEWA_052210 [Theileria equi strain WA]|uniref:Uncharacterized protein n=1 Tax=Theileria equi strain WA TaxID=1537102 RepID=L1LCU6_THEEQ|nr:hypothetical protein BEWA_052210 [Theileria equi strain WA]EKX73166.1 hypothetical protein BEWA_052210 [Theileria equi strain WA]|eukprot:XP_004832618.1 hypothetical protein BEWA_052210 [Theileria equi strain WA]
MDDDLRNNQLASSLLNACDGFKLESTDENLPQLLDFIEFFRYLSHFGESKLASIYTSKIEKILKLKEKNLFKSLNNDPNHCSRIIAEVKRIGFSDTERVIIGFLENRSRYIKECLENSRDFAKKDPKSGLNEVILTLKKGLHSTVLCYRTVFGGVDVHLSTFVNKSIQDAMSTIRSILRENDMGDIGSEETLDLSRELDSISDSFGSFGLSFKSLIMY